MKLPPQTAKRLADRTIGEPFSPEEAETITSELRLVAEHLGKSNLKDIGGLPLIEFTGEAPKPKSCRCCGRPFDAGRAR